MVLGWSGLEVRSISLPYNCLCKFIMRSSSKGECFLKHERRGRLADKEGLGNREVQDAHHNSSLPVCVLIANQCPTVFQSMLFSVVE